MKKTYHTSTRSSSKHKGDRDKTKLRSAGCPPERLSSITGVRTLPMHTKDLLKHKLSSVKHLVDNGNLTPTIKKDAIKMSKKLEEYLTNFREDVVFLMPQLKTEIKALEIKGGRFKGVQTEANLWTRFIHCYAKYCGNLSKACDFCGISRMHFYRAKDRYPTLRTLVELIDDRFIDSVEELTKRHALLPNSIIERLFLLKTQRKAKYSEDEGKTKPTDVKITFNNIKMMREEGSDDRERDRKPVSSTSPTIEVS